MPESLEMRAAQARKICELQDVLSAAGLHTTAEQSRALGIWRSTAWTIRKANHKGSGLSAAVINQILAAPQLPLAVRGKILESIDDKAGGRYGHNRKQCREFIEKIAMVLLPDGRETFLRRIRATQYQQKQTKTPPLQSTKLRRAVK